MSGAISIKDTGVGVLVGVAASVEGRTVDYKGTELDLTWTET